MREGRKQSQLRKNSGGQAPSSPSVPAAAASGAPSAAAGGAAAVNDDEHFETIMVCLCRIYMTSVFVVNAFGVFLLCWLSFFIFFFAHVLFLFFFNLCFFTGSRR